MPDTASIAPPDAPIIVIPLEARQSIEVELSTLLDETGLSIFPHVEEKGLLFCQFRQKKVIISAGPYIGVIPLTPKVSIEVRPKLPVRNLGRILDAARVSLSSLDGITRNYRTANLTSSSVLEFLLENLLDALNPIENYGVHKEYVSRTLHTSNPRGRIDLNQTLMSNWSRGQKHLISVHQYQQTSNVPVNRVIKSALRFALGRLKQNSEASVLCIRRANSSYYNYPNSVDDARDEDIAICREALITHRLPSSRSYYYPALEIALLILNNRGAALLHYGNELTLEAFILNFEVLFEQYLRRTLQSTMPPGVSVADGNEYPGKKQLFDDTRNHPAQPDIVVRSAISGTCVIAEVKYKEKPNRQDINQAITYAVSYRSAKALIVHQSSVGSHGGLRHIGNLSGISLGSYGFNLGNVDLEQEETAFRECLFSMLT